MFTKTLGLLDIIAALIIIAYSILPSKLILFAALYLVIKGVLFALTSSCFINYIDIFTGLYIMLLYFGISFSFVTVLCLLFLMTKGVLSMF